MDRSLIRAILREAEKYNREQTVAFMADESGKKHREGWVLGRFSRVLNPRVDAARRWGWAESREDSADFAVFVSDDATSWLCDVQICEGFEVGYHRSKTYKEDLPHRSQAGEVPDPWQILRKTIEKKLMHRGRQPTWLLVYENIVESMLDEWAAVREIEEVLRTRSNPFAEIWVLQHSADQALRAFPDRLKI